MLAGQSVVAVGDQYTRAGQAGSGQSREGSIGHVRLAVDCGHFRAQVGQEGGVVTGARAYLQDLGVRSIVLAPLSPAGASTK